MKHEIASEILNSDNWSAHACVGCSVRFRDSIASRPGRVDGEVDLLCRDCAYQYDIRELKLTGVMSGTSLATAAYLRRDLDTFRMFFEAEVSLTPTLQAAWARYKDHPAINHPSLKRALLVNTATGELHDRYDQPVGQPPVERELVHLEVTRVQNRPAGRADHDGQRIRDRVVHRDELAVEDTEPLAIPFSHPERVGRDLVFLELGLDERERQL